MDFFKLLRSLDELLFEILTWIIYYPRTLWMVVRRPLRMIDYSNHEQVDSFHRGRLCETRETAA